MLDGTRQSDFAPASTVPDALLLPLAFDPARLRADLDLLADVGWTDHMVRQNYDGDWSVMPLRCVAGATHPILMIHADPGATAFVETPALARAPYLRAVLATLRCPLQTARLMRLTPGSLIRPHRDADLAAEWGVARLHIPVVTNAAVDFRLNGRRIAMAAGSCWYLRLADTHSVANRGPSDRVHLVVDCVVNDWLRALLHDGAPVTTI